MAKRTSRKSSSRKATSRSSSKSINKILLFPFHFRRIVLITTCLALFAIAFHIADNHGRQGVAGISITNGFFAQATISMPLVEKAVSYNIYYKKINEGSYKNSVRDIPLTVKAYTISYLTKGATYTYKVAAVDGSGAEFWWSEEKTLTNLSPM